MNITRTQKVTFDYCPKSAVPSDPDQRIAWLEKHRQLLPDTATCSVELRLDQWKDLGFCVHEDGTVSETSYGRRDFVGSASWFGTVLTDAVLKIVAEDGNVVTKMPEWAVAASFTEGMKTREEKLRSEKEKEDKIRAEEAAKKEQKLANGRKVLALLTEIGDSVVLTKKQEELVAEYQKISTRGYGQYDFENGVSVYQIEDKFDEIAERVQAEKKRVVAAYGASQDDTIRRAVENGYDVDSAVHKIIVNTVSLVLEPGVIVIQCHTPAWQKANWERRDSPNEKALNTLETVKEKVQRLTAALPSFVTVECREIVRLTLEQEDEYGEDSSKKMTAVWVELYPGVGPEYDMFVVAE